MPPTPSEIPQNIHKQEHLITHIHTLHFHSGTFILIVMSRHENTLIWKVMLHNLASANKPPPPNWSADACSCVNWDLTPSSYELRCQISYIQAGEGGESKKSGIFMLLMLWMYRACTLQPDAVSCQGSNWRCLPCGEQLGAPPDTLPQ